MQELKKVWGKADNDVTKSKLRVGAALSSVKYKKYNNHAL